MNDNDNILEDLEATDATEVTGGAGPTFEVNAMGVGAEMDDNRHGGSTLNVAGAEVETRQDDSGNREVNAEYGDTEAGARIKL